ncbi:MAG: hypothetical protein HYV09_39870 [Deltaproteobacteria bacterium]|nr:hypothetical protein [Deltaproteobacteria bacterium]
MKRFLPILALFLLVGCSDDDTSSPATTEDTGVLEDTLTATESGADAAAEASDDAGAETGGDAAADTLADALADTVAVDAATAACTEAGTDAGGTGAGCHAVTFGAPPATITKVTALPAMTGGTIVPGIYDAVDARTTGTSTGTYRATWSFVVCGVVESIDQITLTESPPTPTPRTFTWAATDSTLTRAPICGGTAGFTNTYRARTDATGTFLDVRSDTVMFTFKKR